MSNDWKSGLTFDEYRNFVRMNEPYRSARVLLTGIAERFELAAGRSGGYTESGSGYNRFGWYPAQWRFVSSSSRRQSPIELVVDRFCRLVQDYRWVMAEDAVSGGTVRLWNNHMPELLTSIGLAEFADSSQPTGYRVPRFAVANRADIFIGVASGLSLLKYAVGAYSYPCPCSASVTWEYLEGYARQDSAFAVTVSSRTSGRIDDNIYPEREWLFAYRGGTSDHNRMDAILERPLFLTVSNGGVCPLHFYALFSGNVNVTSVDCAANVSNFQQQELETVAIRCRISSGGIVQLPVSGYYTFGKTLEQTLPEADHAVFVSAVPQSGGWKRHGGFVCSGMSGRTGMERFYDMVEIGQECRFFRDDQESE